MTAELDEIKGDVEAVKADVEKLRDRLERGDQRFIAHMKRMDSIDHKLDRLDDGMRELLTIWASLKGFARVSGWIWWVGKHLLWIGLVMGAVYAWGKSGEWQWPRLP